MVYTCFTKIHMFKSKAVLLEGQGEVRLALPRRLNKYDGNIRWDQ